MIVDEGLPSAAHECVGIAKTPVSDGRFLFETTQQERVRTAPSSESGQARKPIGIIIRPTLLAKDFIHDVEARPRTTQPNPCPRTPRVHSPGALTVSRALPVGDSNRCREP